MTGAHLISETIEQFSAWGGGEVIVYRNPSKAQFDRLIERERCIRALLSPDGNDIWIWSAYAAIHTNAMEELGLDNRYDCLSYCRSTGWVGPVYRGFGFPPVIERITPARIDKTEDDALLRSLSQDL